MCKCVIWFQCSGNSGWFLCQQWLLESAHVRGIFTCCLFFVHHQVKNAGRKLGRRCDMCSNYEKQLQAIQGQEAETRDQVSVWAASSSSSMLVCDPVWTPVFQVKKLQVMLRQANEQLERTMADKQKLEDSVQAANKETAAKVSKLSLLCLHLQFNHISCRSLHSPVSLGLHSLPITISELLKILRRFWVELRGLLTSGGYDRACGNFQQHKMQIFQLVSKYLLNISVYRKWPLCWAFYCFAFWIFLLSLPHLKTCISPYLAAVWVEKTHHKTSSQNANNFTAASMGVFTVFIPSGVHPAAQSPGVWRTAQLIATGFQWSSEEHPGASGEQHKQEVRLLRCCLMICRWWQFKGIWSAIRMKRWSQQYPQRERKHGSENFRPKAWVLSS